MPVCDFAVRYEIELPGSSPEQVAELVRDQLLNQDAPLVLDILPMRYDEAMGESVSSDVEGWQARFKGGDAPVELVPWEDVPL